MRVGDVTFTVLSPGKWRYNWHEKNQRFQQTALGLSAKDAREIAHELNAKLQRKKLGLGRDGQGAPSLMDGFDLAREHSRARARHRKNRKCDIKLFMSWLEAYAPDVKTWGELRPQHVHAYQRHLESTGKSFWRIKGRLEPIAQAWHAVHANYPAEVLAPPRIDMRGIAAPRHRADCLTVAEVKSVMAWLCAHAPDLYPVAALQAMAGLRVYEASSLRVEDVDEGQKTIRIDDTDVHELKNKPSHRTLPVAPSLWAILAPWWQDAKDKSRTYLFVGQRGKCLTNVIVKRWERALDHLVAAPTEIKRKVTGKKLTLNRHGLNRPELDRVPPSKLRVSFATSLIGKVDRDLVRLYMGHSGGDVLAEHYQVSSVDLLRPVASVIEEIWCNESATLKVETDASD